MSLYVYLVLGFFAGWIASLVMGERQGFVMNIIVGAIGALLGGFLFGLFGQNSITGLNLWSFIVALSGAIILIAFCRAIRGPQVS
ncbi:MAG: GlsB/YeaQ/YmgE family stress response membrane protein [Armatimonadetes bacterium]|nr:GlsB/YeaQ/YmgE family stress response membrane protein [Armatimonadota bacterium]